MARLFLLAATVGAVTVGCGTSPSTQERQATPPMRVEAAPAPASVATVPENPADAAIRRTLTGAIASDAGLIAGEISFDVNNGNVSFTGIVRSEDERRKLNDLAMNIDGVKSVANALRVAE